MSFKRLLIPLKRSEATKPLNVGVSYHALMKALPFIPLTAFFACTPKHSLEEKLPPQANPAVVVPAFIVKRVY